MTGVVSSVERATVEYIDQHDVAETPPGEDCYPAETTYDEVEVLPNGWVRGVGPNDVDGEQEAVEAGRGRSVDYFPPGRVCRILTTETEDADDPRSSVDARAPSLIGALRSLTPLPARPRGVSA